MFVFFAILGKKGDSKVDLDRLTPDNSKPVAYYSTNIPW